MRTLLLALALLGLPIAAQAQDEPGESAQRARIAARVSSVRFGFLITRSGEPGIIRNIRKFRTRIAQIVTNACTTFRPR